MLAGRARVIAEMHNWERIWKAWLPERSTMSPIVEINRDADGSWQSASVRNSCTKMTFPLDVNLKIMQQCPLQYWLQLKDDCSLQSVFKRARFLFSLSFHCISKNSVWKPLYRKFNSF